jgi:CDGSH-type Zn-finger protein
MQYTKDSKLFLISKGVLRMGQCGCGNTQNAQGQCDGSHAKGGK